MKIKTIEKLEEKLIQDLSWRKKELIDIKTLIEEEDIKVDKNIFIRAGIALLCAHWEGYIRYAANMYVVYIGGLKLTTNELKDNFLALSLKKNIINAGKSEKNSVHSRLMNEIDQIKKKNFYLKYTDDNRIITTDSNLSYELFSEILLSISIENQYELKKNYIDSNLLKTRHEIVHGEKTSLKSEDFITTFDIVMPIMEDFKERIIDAAENKKYLKDNDEAS